MRVFLCLQCNVLTGEVDLKSAQVLVHAPALRSVTLQSFNEPGSQKEAAKAPIAEVLDRCGSVIRELHLPGAGFMTPASLQVSNSGPS